MFLRQKNLDALPALVRVVKFGRWIQRSKNKAIKTEQAVVDKSLFNLPLFGVKLLYELNFLQEDSKGYGTGGQTLFDLLSQGKTQHSAR